MNKKQKSLTNKGFSLVELIIVIAIIHVSICLSRIFRNFFLRTQNARIAPGILHLTQYQIIPRRPASALLLQWPSPALREVRPHNAGTHR